MFSREDTEILFSPLNLYFNVFATTEITNIIVSPENICSCNTKNSLRKGSEDCLIN
jgi:hypothetical protein